MTNAETAATADSAERSEDVDQVDSEARDSEARDSEARDSEAKNADQVDSEAKDSEAKDSEAKDVAAGGPGGEDRLVAEGEIAGDYLEELLDLLDFDGDIDLDVEGDRAIVSIDGGGDLTKLVGGKGEVLDALQELTRLAVHQKTGERSRLMLDVAQWRMRRRDELSVLGDKVAHRVLETGEREELSPMTPFERKIVHDAVAGVQGVHSESEGVEPSRRVVVLTD